MALGEASPFTINGGISLSSGVPARMCRVALLVTLISLVRVSTQAPPRLSSCRNIYKAKDINEFYPFQGCKYYDVLFGQNIVNFPGVWGQGGMTTCQQFGSMAYSIFSHLQLNNFTIALKL